MRSSCYLVADMVIIVACSETSSIGSIAVRIIVLSGIFQFFIISDRNRPSYQTACKIRQPMTPPYPPSAPDSSGYCSSIYSRQKEESSERKQQIFIAEVGADDLILADPDGTGFFRLVIEEAVIGASATW